MEAKEAREIIQNIKPERTPYNRTDYILSIYRDLKNGAVVAEAPRSVIDVIDNAVGMIADDRYTDIIRYAYFDGKTISEIASITNMEERTIYRQKKRLVKRLAIILYGDEALKE